MRSSLRQLTTVCVLCLVWATAGPMGRAGAQEEHGAATHEAPAAHGAASQPNIFEYALDLTIWTIVVFLVLLYVLKKYAWAPMLEGLRKREENIRAATEEARRAREEAQQLHDRFQAEMAKAGEKARDMVEAARRSAQQTTEEMVAKARQEIQTERDRLRREIDMARDQALQEIWNQAARLATVVSAKAIRRQLTEDDHRRLVEEALTEIGSATTRSNRG